jgi:hypothetical protein
LHIDSAGGILHDCSLIKNTFRTLISQPEFDRTYNLLEL